MKVILNFLLLLYVVHTTAQEISVKNYTVKDGLPTDSIISISKDSINQLVLQTTKGDILFDGREFSLKEKVKNNYTNSLYKYTYKAHIQNFTEFYKTKKIGDFLVFFKHKKNLYYVFKKSIIQMPEKSVIDKTYIDSALKTIDVKDVFKTKKAIYVLNEKGLFSIPFNKFQKTPKQIVTDKVNAFATLNDSIIYLSKKNKLYTIINGIKKDSISFTSEIKEIEKINNELWLNLKANAIQILSLPSLTFRKSLNKYNTLTTNDVNSIYFNYNFVWLATYKGLTRVSLNSINDYKEPKVYLTEVLVNNKPYEFKNNDGQLLLNSDERNITFSFKSISYKYPKKIIYRYKLKDKFSTWSKNKNIAFHNLNYGKHTFYYQSNINEKLSSLESISFTIQKPFYFKPWFIFATIIAILFALYYFVHKVLEKQKKKHVLQLKKEEEKNYVLSLENKALRLQMNPHFIFNILNSIKAYGKQNNITHFERTISQFSNLLRTVLKSTRENELSLKEEIEYLKNYMELEKSIYQDKFDYQIKISAKELDLEEIYLPSMLIQPFVENAIKHGFEKQKGFIKITFEINNNHLNCSIIDNGSGFNIDKLKNKSNSYGISITKERINSLSKYNRFTIKSSKDGTQIYFRLPLKTDY